MAIIPAVEAVHVPAHFEPPVCPQAKQLLHHHAQLSLRQSCHRQKKSCIYMRRVTLVVSDSLRPCRLWPARLLCQGGDSPGKTPPAMALSGPTANPNIAPMGGKHCCKVSFTPPPNIKKKVLVWC